MFREQSAHLRLDRGSGLGFAFGLVAVGATLLSGCASSPGSFRPLSEAGSVAQRVPGTHSHNDFQRRRPLADALERGFASIEVDVALRNGTFYVAHDSAKIDRSSTLVGLYLTPLAALATKNGGFVYPNEATPLQLLLDVKSDGDSAYEALEVLLAEYGELFTRWRIGEPTRLGAVTVVMSGNRARELILADPDRRLALDGRIWEDRDRFSPEVMPLISINWDDTASPRPDWPADADRMEIARLFVERVHDEGRTVRFWNTPDREQTWSWLRALGVDWIGTDDARRLADFLAVMGGSDARIDEARSTAGDAGYPDPANQPRVHHSEAHTPTRTGGL